MINSSNFFQFSYCNLQKQNSFKPLSFICSQVYFDNYWISAYFAYEGRHREKCFISVVESIHSILRYHPCFEMMSRSDSFDAKMCTWPKLRPKTCPRIEVFMRNDERNAAHRESLSKLVFHHKWFLFWQSQPFQYF